MKKRLYLQMDHYCEHQPEVIKYKFINVVRRPFSEGQYGGTPEQTFEQMGHIIRKYV